MLFDENPQSAWSSLWKKICALNQPAFKKVDPVSIKSILISRNVFTTEPLVRWLQIRNALSQQRIWADLRNMDNPNKMVCHIPSSYQAFQYRILHTGRQINEHVWGRFQSPSRILDNSSPTESSRTTILRQTILRNNFQLGYFKYIRRLFWVSWFRFRVE